MLEDLHEDLDRRVVQDSSGTGCCYTCRLGLMVPICRKRRRWKTPEVHNGRRCTKAAFNRSTRRLGRGHASRKRHFGRGTTCQSLVERRDESGRFCDGVLLSTLPIPAGRGLVGIRQSENRAPPKIQGCLKYGNGDVQHASCPVVGVGCWCLRAFGSYGRRSVNTRSGAGWGPLTPACLSTYK